MAEAYGFWHVEFNCLEEHTQHFFDATMWDIHDHLFRTLMEELGLHSSGAHSLTSSNSSRLDGGMKSLNDTFDQPLPVSIFDFCSLLAPVVGRNVSSCEHVGVCRQLKWVFKPPSGCVRPFLTKICEATG